MSNVYEIVKNKYKRDNQPKNEKCNEYLLNILCWWCDQQAKFKAIRRVDAKVLSRIR